MLGGMASGRQLLAGAPSSPRRNNGGGRVACFDEFITRLMRGLFVRRKREATCALPLLAQYKSPRRAGPFLIARLNASFQIFCSSLQRLGQEVVIAGAQTHSTATSRCCLTRHDDGWSRSLWRSIS